MADEKEPISCDCIHQKGVKAMCEFWNLFHIPICIMIGIGLNGIVTKLYYRHMRRKKGDNQ